MCSVVSTTDELYTPTYRTPELFIDVANHMNVVTLLIAGSTRPLDLPVYKETSSPSILTRATTPRLKSFSKTPAISLAAAPSPS
ncbi:hypothetical protein ACFX2F_014335 [Malus domestica]